MLAGVAAGHLAGALLGLLGDIAALFVELLLQALDQALLQRQHRTVLLERQGQQLLAVRLADALQPQHLQMRLQRLALGLQCRPLCPRHRVTAIIRGQPAQLVLQLGLAGLGGGQLIAALVRAGLDLLQLTLQLGDP